MRKESKYLTAEGLEYRPPYQSRETRSEDRPARENPFYGFQEGHPLEDSPEALRTRRR